jgi:hypothetical protein
MSESVEQGGGAAALGPRGIGEILTTAFQLYRRHWRTLLGIAAVVVVPLTLLEYVFGRWLRTQGEVISNGVVVSTSFWAAATASLLAALVGLLIYQVLTGAITRAIAAEVVGEDPGVEQSYRFGFMRLWSILLVSVVVGLATVAGLIVFIIPGIYIGVRLAVSIQALGGGGQAGDRGDGPLLGAGRWPLVARVRHAASRRPDHRGRERRDHRAVQRWGLVRPGDCCRGGDDRDAAVRGAGWRAALP